MRNAANAVGERTLEQAKKVAVDLLSRREHCRLELKQKLLQRGFSSELIIQTIAYCLENQWLNEANYARIFVRQRALKGYGPSRIRQELQQCELGETDVMAAFNELEQEAEVDWFESAKWVREKRFGSSWPNDFKQQKKQQAYLYRRGFNTEQIRYACSNEF